MASIIYVCPKGGERHHSPGICPKHKAEMEQKCANCGHSPKECICN